MSSSPGPGDRLGGDRYVLERELGSGGFGTTWRALDTQTDTQVAVKLLRMDRVEQWKSIELFEREGDVLRGLDHPGIPTYLDSFSEASGPEDAPQTAFVLVQQLIQGDDLETRITRDSWRPAEEEVKEVVCEVLEILVYLQERRPPIIHRDIKPSNVIRGSDGRLYLIDFGAVKATWEGMGNQSTVAGTFGYMAPEQLRGQATPATDVYGVAATALFLLTREDPAKLPGDGLSIDFRAVLSLSPSLDSWLHRALQPSPSARFPSAADALQALQAPSPTTPAPTPRDAPEDGPDAPEGEDDEARFFFDEAVPDDLDQLTRTGPDVRSGVTGWTLLWWVLLAASAVAPGVLGVSALGVVLLSIASILFMIGVLVTMQGDGAHPALFAREYRRELWASLLFTTPLFLVQHVLILANVGMASAWLLGGLTLVFMMMAMVPILSMESAHEHRRQDETERRLGVELPIIPRSENHKMPFEVTDYAPGRVLALSGEAIGLKQGAMWSGQMLLWFGAIMGGSLLGVLPFAGTGFALGVPLFALLFVYTFIKGLSARPTTLRIDRDAGTLSVHGEERTLELPLSEIRRIGAHEQPTEDSAGVYVLTALLHDGTPETLWTLEEDNLLARKAQLAMLQTRLDEVLGFTPEPHDEARGQTRSGEVVFDHTRQKDAGESAAQQVTVQATTRRANKNL